MVENPLLNLIPQRNDAILAYRIFDGQAVVVDLTQGTLNALNTTATRIWQLMEEGMSVGEIAKNITQEFEVSLREATDDTLDVFRTMAAM